jgi:hypothetical protein
MHVALALTLALSVGQIRLQDEAVDQGSILQINCSGTGINCTRSGSTGTLTVAAGVTPGSACSSGQALYWNGTAYSCVDSWVNTTGDTMTGNLTITAAASMVEMVVSAPSSQATDIMQWKVNGTTRARVASLGGFDTTDTSNGYGINGFASSFWAGGLIAYSNSQGTNLYQQQSGVTTTIRTNTVDGQTGTIIGSFGTNAACGTTCWLLKIQDGIAGTTADLFTVRGDGRVKAANNYEFSDSSVQTTAIGAATCLGSKWVSTVGNTSVCTQPGFVDISGTVSDSQLASSYSGVGTCSAGSFVSKVERNTAPTCTSMAHLLWGDQHTDVYTTDTVAHGDLIYYAGAADPPFNQSKWRLLHKAASDDYLLMSGGTATAPQYVQVPDSDATTQKLQYDQSTNTFTAGTDLNTSFVMQAGSLNMAAPADGANSYFGCTQQAPVTTAGTQRCYIPKAGTIKAAYVYAHAGTAGTSESWTCSIDLNRGTLTTIQALASASQERIWSNTGLSIAVAQGDFFEIKCANPTWATNPANVLFSASISVE